MSSRRSAAPIVRCTLALLVMACGAATEEPREPESAAPSGSEDVPPERPAERVTSDEQARERAARAFREIVAPSLRPERAAVADAWERNLAEAGSGHVTRGPCRELAARLRDSIESLGTPDSERQQVLYGAPEDLDEGECVTVHVGVGFDTLVTAMRPSDGRLLLVWDVPEG